MAGSALVSAISGKRLWFGTRGDRSYEAMSTNWRGCFKVLLAPKSAIDHRRRMPAAYRVLITTPVIPSSTNSSTTVHQRYAAAGSERVALVINGLILMLTLSVRLKLQPVTVSPAETSHE